MRDDMVEFYNYSEDGWILDYWSMTKKEWLAEVVLRPDWVLSEDIDSLYCYNGFITEC